jgi:hypothetical protein
MDWATVIWISVILCFIVVFIFKKYKVHTMFKKKKDNIILSKPPKEEPIGPVEDLDSLVFDPNFIDIDYKESNYLAGLHNQKEAVDELLRDRTSKYKLAKKKWQEIIEIEKKLRNTIKLLKKQKEELDCQIKKAEEMSYETNNN